MYLSLFLTSMYIIIYLGHLNNLFNCHTSTFKVSKLDSLLDFINFCMMTCTGLNALKQMNVNDYTPESESVSC